MDSLPGKARLGADKSNLSKVDILDAIQSLSTINQHSESFIRQTSQEIVFIDSSVDDFVNLSIAISNSSSKVFLLDETQNGIVAISQLLSQFQDVKAIHIVSHGSTGNIQIGSLQLTLETLSDYASIIQQWSNALSGNADILIYGCAVAGSEDGIKLLERLKTLTGANIAASSRPVGNPQRGGQWLLDVNLGTISTPLAFHPELIETYSGIFEASAYYKVDPSGSGINTSTYTKGSFSITNTSTSGENISRVLIDLTSSLLPDLVFDPFGTAGDPVGKKFSVNSNPGVGTITHNYLAAKDGGYAALEILFTDFNPGEKLTFSIDIDPTSTKGAAAPGPGESASVSGLEQIGSVVTVNFSEGTTLVGQPYRVPTSLDGAQVTLKSNAPAKPTLQVLNVAASKAVINSAEQVVRVSAPVGSQVALLIAEAAMFTTNGVAFDVDPFEANSVIQVSEKTATVGAAGFVDILVTLSNSNPEGGYNHLVAAVKDAQGHTGLLSEVHVLQLVSGTGGNTAPTTSGIANVAVVQDAPDTVIDLFAAFADAEDADTELTYSVVSNSNSSLFDSVTVDGATGKLTLNYAPTATGTAQLAVKATDTGGLSTTTNFTVSVSTPPPPPLEGAIRINVGGGQYIDEQGQTWLADSYFIGGKTYTTTKAIAGTTLDPLYQTERYAQSLSYAIPVVNGTYDIGLALAEIYFSTTGKRIFDISVEGQLIQDDLDIFAKAGSFNALNILLEDVVVNDGVLNINLSSSINNAKLSAIEVLTDGLTRSIKTTPTPTPTPTPLTGVVRINSGGGQYTDTLGQVWQGDAYFTGGTTYTVANTTEIFKTEDDPLYRNERSGKSFSYQIPVANGDYTVNLHYAEIYWDDFNKRVFDVSIEGELVSDDLDIFANSKNAFFPGKNSALVQSVQDVLVSDGVLNINFDASINNASIAAIEIIPFTDPAVIIKQTNGKTEVVEGGGSDTYSIVLNTKPTEDVVVTLQYDNQVNVNQSVLTFTPNNWSTPQVVTVTAVDDTAAEGSHFSTINHVASSTDGNYNQISVPSISVSIVDNEVVPISFTKKEVATTNDPTVGTWGPDGRLYVGSYSGTITVYNFDDNYNVTATQTINTIKNLYNAQILGIAFNPFDTSGQPKLYVAHSKLYSNGGDAFPATQLSPYSGQVSVLTGPDFAVAQPLVTGIGVSNHDHGVNGLEFDSQGNLLIAVGGNTNAGIPADKIGGLPESPFTAAILKAEITKPNFNGQIKYTVPAGSVVPTSYPTGYQPPAGQAIGAAEHQVNGGMADVVSGVDVSVYASGLRNSFDLTLTTKGLLYATDNGANKGFGDFSTSATTQSPLNNQGLDELNLIKPGEYYGSPNRNRGRYDDRQNVYYNHNAASIPGKHVAPLTTFGPSTNGIIEYRATTFGGQLRGNLLAQDWNGALFNLTLSADGQQVTKKEELIGVSDGLDVLTGPGGAIVGIDFSDDAISVATPNDVSVTEVTAYDIFPWRAPAVGGQQFIIGGANFGNLSNTQVTVGGVAATLSSVSANRIKGVLPTLNPTGGELLDIVVTSAGQTSILTDGFLPV
jgi:glucose/arabinose dehydrogenase